MYVFYISFLWFDLLSLAFSSIVSDKYMFMDEGNAYSVESYSYLVSNWLIKQAFNGLIKKYTSICLCDFF